LKAGMKVKPSKRVKVCKGKTGLFNLWDRNCDGKTNIGELKEGWKSMDIDRDGGVSEKEFKLFASIN